MGAMQLFGLQRVIHSLEQTMTHHQEQLVLDIQKDLKELMGDLDRLALNLSRPREIVNAVQTTDNDVLFDWSNAFVSRIDSIIFTDHQGLVIARAPDEFRFGDSVSEKIWFEQAMADGSYHGIANIDGRDCMVSSRAIRKYNDTPVGVVAVTQSITPRMLKSFVTDSNLVLLYAGWDGVIESQQYTATPTRSLLIDLTTEGYADPGAFEVLVLPDESHGKLMKLKTSLYFMVMGISLLTLIAMFYLLNRQLQPYRHIVDTVLAYSSGKVTLEKMQSRLQAIRAKPSHEVRMIVDALLRMVKTLASNFQRIEHYTGQLEQLASTDALTQLHNRASMDAILERETTRSTRYGSALSVILLDIDHFKSVNDTYGHEVGDQVLELVAATLRTQCREADFVGRWGGEEFLIVCPEVDARQGMHMAERLRRAVPRQVMPHGKTVTVSLGVTQFLPEDSVHALVARADKAMYTAKTEGRNRARSL